MKDQRRKRRNEQHVEEEANFIGDILKLLFALSLAIVAIVVCFLFFKNIAGFSLPNLKATEAASESSKEPVLITEAGKETKKKETEATIKTTEETTEEETTTKSEETSKEATKESTKESSSMEESSSSKKKESISESPTLESQSGKKSSTAATKESTAAQKSSKSQGPDDAIVGEGPKSADDSGENQGPGNP